jgi:hypothetical protein
MGAGIVPQVWASSFFDVIRNLPHSPAFRSGEPAAGPPIGSFTVERSSARLPMTPFGRLFMWMEARRHSSLLRPSLSERIKRWSMFLRAMHVACLPFLCGALSICAQSQQPTRGTVKGELDYPNGKPAKGFMVSVIGTSRTSTNGVETMTEDVPAVVES